jgi:hypothetical protein
MWNPLRCCCGTAENRKEGKLRRKNMESTLDLSRFVQAQKQSYPAALAEIRAGRKRSHWMWYIFPQLRGLGHSSMANYYGIGCADEARAYLADPVLGAVLHASSGYHHDDHVQYPQARVSLDHGSCDHQYAGGILGVLYGHRIFIYKR